VPLLLAFGDGGDDEHVRRSSERVRIDVHVALGGGKVGMAKLGLDRAEANAARVEVRGDGVAPVVGRAAADASLRAPALDDGVDAAAVEAAELDGAAGDDGAEEGPGRGPAEQKPGGDGVTRANRQLIALLLVAFDAPKNDVAGGGVVVGEVDADDGGDAATGRVENSKEGPVADARGRVVAGAEHSATLRRIHGIAGGEVGATDVLDGEEARELVGGQESEEPCFPENAAEGAQVHVDGGGLVAGDEVRAEKETMGVTDRAPREGGARGVALREKGRNGIEADGHGGLRRGPETREVAGGRVLPGGVFERGELGRDEVGHRDELGGRWRKGQGVVALVVAHALMVPNGCDISEFVEVCCDSPTKD